MACNTQAAIQERREKVWSFLTRGMKGYEIARGLNVKPSTISRDIHYLTAQSHNYIDKLARETVPFMYQSSIEGIRQVLQEAWRIYLEGSDDGDKIAALQLAKACHESMFKLTSEGPFVMSVRDLERRLIEMERRRSD